MRLPFYAAVLLLFFALTLLLEARGGVSVEAAAGRTSLKLLIKNYDALVQGAESMFRDQSAGVGGSWEAVAAAFETALHSAGTGGVISSSPSHSSQSLLLSSSRAAATASAPAKTLALDVLCDATVTTQAHRARFPYLSMGLAYKGIAEKSDSGHQQVIESLELSLLSLLRAVEGSPKSALTWHELGTVSTAFLRRGAGLGGPDLASYNATSPSFHRLLLAFAESRYFGAAVRGGVRRGARRGGRAAGGEGRRKVGDGDDGLLATTLEDLMFEVSLHSLQRAHRLDPTRAATCNNLAITHYMVGESNWHKAITLFKKAIGLHMGKILAGKGEERHVEADARMQGLCAARRNFGSLLSRMGFHGEAEKQLRSVASSCPGEVRIGVEEM